VSEAGATLDLVSLVAQGGPAIVLVAIVYRSLDRIAKTIEHLATHVIDIGERIAKLEERGRMVAAHDGTNPGFRVADYERERRERAPTNG